jgi:hypothetical protein
MTISMTIDDDRSGQKALTKTLERISRRTDAGKPILMNLFAAAIGAVIIDYTVRGVRRSRFCVFISPLSHRRCSRTRRRL